MKEYTESRLEEDKEAVSGAGSDIDNSSEVSGPDGTAPESAGPEDAAPEDAVPESGKKADQEDQEPFDLKREVISWLQVIAMAALIAFCVNGFFIANSRVPSASMENTIMTGDRVIGSRLSYRFGKDPERGDIIIFRWPDNEKVLFVKRIIGLPGDVVEIRGGHVYLNGSEEPLEETYIREDMYLEPPMGFVVPEDAYFVMGDNRNESLDARYWKKTFVYRDKIVAKVLFRYWPSVGKIE